MSCSETKVIGSFKRNPTCRYGTLNKCKECHRKRIKALASGEIQKQQECVDCGLITNRPRAVLCIDCAKNRNRKSAARFYEKNKQHCIDGITSRWLSLPKAERIAIARSQMWSAKYGITPLQYNDLLESQGSVCAICLQEETQQYRGMTIMYAVDHDHSCCPGKKSCGKCIRGLLCHKCNSGLGMFNDNVDSMLRAISYLGKSS